MLNDKTSHIEAEITKENKPKVIFLLRLWKYVFSSATVISSVYLGLYILLSLLRPLLAFIWGKYIDLAASYLPGGEVLPMILLVASYYVINLVHPTFVWVPEILWYHPQ